MQNRALSRNQLIQQLLALGVHIAGVLLVHTSFSIDERGYSVRVS
jgi:hypothetical protein